MSGRFDPMNRPAKPSLVGSDSRRGSKDGRSLGAWLAARPELTAGVAGAVLVAVAFLPLDGRTRRAPRPPAITISETESRQLPAAWQRCLRPDPDRARMLVLDPGCAVQPGADAAARR